MKCQGRPKAEAVEPRAVAKCFGDVIEVNLVAEDIDRIRDIAPDSGRGAAGRFEGEAGGAVDSVAEELARERLR